MPLRLIKRQMEIKIPQGYAIKIVIGNPFNVILFQKPLRQIIDRFMWNARKRAIVLLIISRAKPIRNIFYKRGVHIIRMCTPIVDTSVSYRLRLRLSSRACLAENKIRF